MRVVGKKTKERKMSKKKNGKVFGAWQLKIRIFTEK
jgi:hypothetical protein